MKNSFNSHADETAYLPDWPEPAYNPMLSALNITDDKATFFSRCEVRKDKRYSFANAPIKERKRVALDEMFLPNELSWRLYCLVTDMMYRGYNYADRNISDSAQQKQVNLSAFNPAKAKGVLKLTERDKGVGAAVIAESGLGKTTTMDKVLGAIPQTHRHKASESYYNREFIQVSWVKVKFHGLSMKAAVRNIIEKIDDLTDDNLARELTDNLSVTTHIDKLKLHCAKYNVGMIVLDECQIMVSYKKNGELTTASKGKADFLQQIVNEIPIPFLLIGTPIFEPYLAQSSFLYRRFVEESAMVKELYSVDDPFWTDLVRVYFESYVLPKSGSLSSADLATIHEHSVGNISLLKILVSRALGCLSMAESDKKISMSGLIEMAYLDGQNESENMKTLLLGDSKNNAVKAKVKKQKNSPSSNVVGKQKSAVEQAGEQAAQESYDALQSLL